MGSSAAHQRIRWLRFDLDKCEREGNKCVSLRSSIHHAEHTAPVSCLSSSTSCQRMKPARSFISTQTPWRLMCETKTTVIPPLLSSSFLCLSSILSMLEYVTWKSTECPTISFLVSYLCSSHFLSPPLVLQSTFVLFSLPLSPTLGLNLLQYCIRNSLLSHWSGCRGCSKFSRSSMLTHKKINTVCLWLPNIF